MATTTFFDATFGVRAIGNRTDNTGTPTVDLTAEEDRFDNLDIGAGYIAPIDSFLVAAATVWNIDVGSGATDTDLYIVEGNLPGQGNYIVRLDQAGAVITITAADGSNPRIDEVYLIVADDAYDGGAVSLPRLALRTGVAAASPSAPGADAGWDAWILLATIDLPTAAANIGATTITDERTIASLVIDAITLGGKTADDFSATTHDHDLTYTDIAHEDSRDGHPHATTSLDGMFAAVDNAKLNAIEASADVNETPAELLASIKTVDGPGSGIDADKVDGITGGSISTSGHNHDSRYYTETETNAKFAAKSDTDEAVAVYLAAVGSANVGNLSLVDMAFPSETRDDWGGHAGSSGTISDDNAGFYLVEAQVLWASNATGFRQIQINHSGDGVIALQRMDAISGDSTTVRCSTIVHMNGSETVTAKVYQESGGNLAYHDTHSHFRLTKLGG